MRPILLIAILITILFTICAIAPGFSPEITKAIGDSKSQNIAHIPFFGVQLHTVQWEPEKHRRAVDLMVEAGIQIGRDECHWSHVEQKKGELVIPPDFITNLDYTYKRGREILLLLNYSNPLYDNGKPPTSEEGLAAYARYCRTMVEATKGKVKYFEVWNEPNAEGFWPPKADARAYARLLKVASAAIREANPEAVILAPATSGYAEDFLREMLKEPGVWESFDVLSFHPYCHPASPEAAQKFEQLDALMEELKAQGTTKPVWLSEFGYHTADMGGVTEREQAAYLARFYLLAMTRPYISGVVWYWLGPDGPNPDWGEDRFGLVREDYSKKPSFELYSMLIREFNFPIKSEIISSNPYLIKYQTNDNHLLAGWTDGNKMGLSLRTPTSINLCNYDIEGREYLHSIIELTPYVYSSRHEFQDIKLNEHAWIELKQDNIIARGETKQFDIVKITWGFERINVVLGDFVKADHSQLLKRDSDGRNSSDRNATDSNGFISNGFFSYTKFQLTCPPDFQGDEINVFFGRENLYYTREHNVVLTFDKLKFKVVDPIAIKINPNISRNDRVTIDMEVVNNSQMNQSAVLDVKLDGIFQFSPATFEINNLKRNRRMKIICEIDDIHLFDKNSIHNLKYEYKTAKGVYSSGTDLLSFAKSSKVKTLAIDGDLSDWPTTGDPIRIGERWQVTGEFRPWRGTKDSNARVWTAWNDEWFYFAAEFEDDKFCAEFDDWQVYRNDGFELYFDIDHDGDRAVKTYNEDDFQWGVFPTKASPVVWRWPHYNSASPGAQFVFNRTPKREQTISGTEFTGYIFEAALPMSELKWKPRVGQHIGFNVDFTDADDPEFVHPFGQEVQMSWSGRPNNHLTPNSFADLFLAAPEQKDKTKD